MNFEDFKSKLAHFSEEHNLVQRALELCKISIENCLKENPNEGFPLVETELRFDKQEFVFSHQIFEKPYVKTQINLYQIVQGSNIDIEIDKQGYYILCTDEKGKHFDDLLVYENDPF